MRHRDSKSCRRGGIEQVRLSTSCNGGSGRQRFSPAESIERSRVHRFTSSPAATLPRGIDLYLKRSPVWYSRLYTGLFTEVTHRWSASEWGGRPRPLGRSMETRGRAPRLLQISSAPAPGPTQTEGMRPPWRAAQRRGCLGSKGATELHPVGLQVRPNLTHTVHLRVTSVIQSGSALDSLTR